MREGKTLRQRGMQIMRAAWILLAIGFIAHLVVTRWDAVLELRRTLAVWQPIACLLLIMVGKLLHTEVVRSMIGAVNPQSRFGDAFYAHNVSQLGKYIPGAIWQFVALYEIYRRYGITPSQAVQMMLLENGAMVATSSFIGLWAAPVFFLMLQAYLSWPLIAGIGVVAVGALTAVALTKRFASRGRLMLHAAWRYRGLVVRVVLLFVAMWIVIGLSTVALFAGYEAVSPLYLIALFGMSFVIGFAAPFAPAGIGVRDVVFAIGLAGIVEPQAAAFITIGHRILFIAADLIFGGSAWCAHRYRLVPA
jgi:uncharacterized membrane protein YbhN (UPF0104 family)